MNYSNNSQTILKTGISASSTSVILADGTGDLFPAWDFLATLEKYDSSNRVIKREIVKCAVRVWDICTITRSQESCPQSWDANTQTSVAMSFDDGDVFTHNATAKTYETMDTNISGKLAKVGEKRTWLSPNKVLTTDSSGNEVESTTLPDAVMSSIATNPTILNSVGNAGKYIQTVALGEVVSSATPVAMAVVWNITYNQTFTTNAWANQVRIWWRVVVPYSGYSFWVWKTWANASSSSAAVLILDSSGNTLKSVSMATGTNSVDLAYSTTTANTEYRIVLNDTANWTGWANYPYWPIATTQSTFPYTVWSIYSAWSGLFDNINWCIFTEANINFWLKAYKARANRISEAQFANFAWFVTGTKAIWDMVDLNASELVPTSWFSWLTPSSVLYVSNVAWVLSATKWTVKSVIGKSVTSTSIILDRRIRSSWDIVSYLGLTFTHWAYVGSNVWAETFTNPVYFIWWSLKYVFAISTSNWAGYASLQLSLDWSTWTDFVSISGNQTVTEYIDIPACYIRWRFTTSSGVNLPSTQFFT